MISAAWVSTRRVLGVEILDEGTRWCIGMAYQSILKTSSSTRAEEDQVDCKENDDDKCHRA